MDISYIKRFKLQNGETAFKYPSFPLKYSQLPLNELPDEKIYYLKTLFSNYKLIDLLKEVTAEINYPHISLDNENNITSMKDKTIKIPYDLEEEHRISIREIKDSEFEKLDEHYEAYVAMKYHLFKVGISVKLFRVLSAYINMRNKQYPPQYPNDDIYYSISLLTHYDSYKYPDYPPLSYHMGHFLQYSTYDKEKSIFYLYMPYETAENCLRILYNLSWVSYSTLLIDPRDENDHGWFECDTFLEYTKLIHDYKYYDPIHSRIHPLNPLNRSHLFSIYGYQFPGEPIGQPLRK